MSILVSSSVLIGSTPNAVVHAAPLEQNIPTPGPHGPITVLGDSVLLGSLIYSPTLADQLAGRGWGPVRMRAGEGYSTGFFNTTNSKKVSAWITTWRSQGWDPADLVINLGANDSGICDTNLTCARDAIMHVVDTVGPGHRIWWPQITRFPFFIDQQNNWNTALLQIAAERDDFFTWDWPRVMEAGPFPSSDKTHLNPSGYRLRAQMMAHEITADLAYARQIGPDAPLPPSAGEPSEYFPLPPTRIWDTRKNGPGPLPAQGTLEVDLSPYVPEGTTAVAVNLTSTGTGAPGFLAGRACDQETGSVSSVNHRAGVTRAALAVVPVAANGTICVFTNAAGHVVVDLQGAFVQPDSGGVLFTPNEIPDRLLDTRQTGRASILEVEVPEGADAVAVTLVATQADSPGFVRAYPCQDDPPTVSNVNYLADESIAGAAFVPTSPDGTICIQTLNSVDVIVDITGTFQTGVGLSYVPAVPTRVLDLRNSLGGWSRLHGQGQTIDVRVVPPEAEAVTGTATIVSPLRPTFLRSFPCGEQPPTSSVNALTGDVIANSVTVGVNDDGRLCLFSRSATTTLFDVTGWWIP